MTERSFPQRAALDSSGRIEFHVVPLSAASLTVAETHQPDAIAIDATSSFPLYLQLVRSVGALERLKHIPLLASLEAGADADAIARAIEAGADDCLSNSFDSPDSMARIRAAHRRATNQPDSTTVCYADLTLDKARLRVWQKGKNVVLTIFQMRLLEFLMMHPGQVFSRRQLLREVWGNESNDEGAVTACVARIRRALGERHGDGLIRSIHGAGYALDEDPATSAPLVRND